MYGIKNSTTSINSNNSKNEESKQITKVSNEKNIQVQEIPQNNYTSVVQKQEEKSNSEENKQISKKIDLSKYDYYQQGLNGTYKGFIEDTAELNKLKALIDQTISEFGYKNVKIIMDKSLSKDGTQYFTANKTNVQNLVYNTEGFNIYYYAVKEYSIAQDGRETYFQTRSYIRVK